MIQHLNTQGGLIKTVILVIVILLVLAYFGLNLRSIVNSPTFQDNWDLIKDFIVDLWNNYLKKPFTYIWDVFVRLIWTPAIDNLEKMKAGDPTNIQEMAPQTPLYNGGR